MAAGGHPARGDSRRDEAAEKRIDTVRNRWHMSHMARPIRQCTIAAFALLAACASTGTAPAAATPPTIAPRLTSLERLTWSPSALRQLVNGTVDIQVMIGTDGKPDMSTLSIFGSAASAVNQNEIADWMQRAMFAPATRAGQPVRELWKTRAVLRTTIRQVP